MSTVELSARDRLLAVGLTGGGKTYWMNKYVVRLAKHVAVFDPHRNYGVAWWPSVHDVPRDARRWGVNAPYMSKQQYADEFHAFVERVCRDRVPTVVVDELVLLDRVPQSRDDLMILVTQARNQQVGLGLVVQRAYSLDITMRSQASRVVTFQQCTAVDIRCLNDMAGDDEFVIPCGAKNKAPCEWEPRRRCIKHLRVGEYFSTVIRG